MPKTDHLVLLLVSLITVMFYLDYLISLTHLCFIFLTLYIVSIDVLIYSAAQMQECLINLLTYLCIFQAYDMQFICSNIQYDVVLILCAWQMLLSSFSKVKVCKNNRS